MITKHRPALPLAALACASVLLVAKLGRAQGEPPDTKPERRWGFVFGVPGGASLGFVTGNPRAQAERYDPAHRVSTGLALGYRVSPFIGGALTDWFTFGLGASYGELHTGSYRSKVTLFLFRIETYPLYSRGGVFRDLGINLDFGAGTTSVDDKSTDKQVAASGVASTLGLGVFWETWRWGPLALGPSISYQHNWSDWFARNEVTFGIKAALYKGPSAKDRRP